MKRTVSLLLSIVMLMSMLSGIGLTASAATYSGSCGANVTWSLDTSTDTLTISGTGEMSNYTSTLDIPWFSYRSDIETIVIEDGVTTIGDRAFSECYGLMNVAIGNDVSTIGILAFSLCYNLTGVVLTNNVTSIGDNAFSNCYSLTSVTMGSSVSAIATTAFAGCDRLSVIDVDSANTTYSSQDGVLYNKAKTILVRYPVGKTETTFLIPSSVISISDYALYDCINLKVVEIPNSVNTIGQYAFSDCISLTSVIIPSSVTVIGDNAFNNCGSLIIYGSAGSYAQEYANNNSITFKLLSTIVYSGSCGINVTWNLNTVTGVLAITGTGAMTNYANASSVPWYVNRTYIKTVVIGNGVTTIGNNAFYYNTNITSVTIPNSVVTIGRYAFYYNTNLTSITIPSGVTTIGDTAFAWCKNLTNLTIPNSVTTIGNYAFAYCESLSAIDVDSDNTAYSSQDGVLYNKAKTTLIQYPAKKNGASFTIPNGVTMIKESAFASCKNLVNVIIPSSVATIEDYAFSVCTSLNSITIQNPSCDIFDSPDTIYSGATIYGYAGSTAQAYATAYGMTFVDANSSPIQSVAIRVLPTQTVYALGEPLNLSGLSIDATRESGTTEIISSGFQASGYDSMVTGVQTVTASYQGFTVQFDVTVDSTLDYYPESDHPYKNDTDKSWIIYKPGASSIAVTFSKDTETESDWDFICIYDKDDEQIGKYSGTSLAGKTITVLGDLVKIRLISDNSYTEQGFTVTSIVAKFPCMHTNLETQGAEDATFTEDGYTGDIYCKDCGALVETGTVIPKLSGVTITIAATDMGTVKLDGKDVTLGTAKKYLDGTEFTLTAIANQDFEFIGWQVGNKIISTDTTYVATALADTTYTAVFMNKSTSLHVIFLDMFSNVISSQTVENASEIVIPTPTVFNGYTFNCWSVSENKIKSTTESLTVYALYEKDATKTYTVNAQGCAISYPGNSAQDTAAVPYGTKVTVKMKDATAWQLGGADVAYGSSYSFYVVSDVTLTAITTAVTAKPVVAAVSFAPVNGTCNVEFIATRAMANTDCTYVTSGFVYGKNLTEADLDLSNVGKAGTGVDSGNVKAVYMANTSGDAQFILSYGLLSMRGTASAKAFLTYRDNAGTLHTVYSDTMAYTY